MKLNQNQSSAYPDEPGDNPLFIRLYDTGIRCIQGNVVTVIVVSVFLILGLFVGSILAGALVSPELYSLLIIPLLLSAIPLMAFLIHLRMKKKSSISSGVSTPDSSRTPTPSRSPSRGQSPPPFLRAPIPPRSVGSQSHRPPSPRAPVPPRSVGSQSHRPPSPRAPIPPRSTGSQPHRPPSPPDALPIEGYDPRDLIDVPRPIPGFQAFDPSMLEDVVSPFGPEGGSIFLDDSGVPFIIPPDRDMPPSPVLGIAASIPPVIPAPSASPVPPVIPAPSASPVPPVIPTPSASPVPPVIPAPSASPVPPVIPTPSASPVPPVIPIPFRLEPGQLPQTTLELLNQIQYVLGEHCWKLTLFNPLQGIYGERTHAISKTRVQIFVFNPRFRANYVNNRDISLLEGIILSHHVDNVYPQNPPYKLPPTNGNKTAFVFTKDLNVAVRSQDSSGTPVLPDSLEQKIYSLIHDTMKLPFWDPRPQGSDRTSYQLSPQQGTVAGFRHLTQLAMPGLEGLTLCAIYVHFYSKYLAIFRAIMPPTPLHTGIEHLAINMRTLDLGDNNPEMENATLTLEDLYSLEERLIYAACLQALTDSGILEGAAARGQEFTVHILLDMSAGSGI